MPNLGKHFWGLFFLLAILGQPLFAEDSGQIINVNQNYQVAFTDLDNQSLKQGDIVKVFVSDDDFIYMQVLESSAILSKLGVSQMDNFKTNLTDLQHISVGNKVMLLSKSADSDEERSDLDKALESKNTLEAQQIKELSTELKDAQAQIADLQQANLALKAQISQAPPPVPVQAQCPQGSGNLGQLKDKLEKMQQIIDQN